MKEIQNFRIEKHLRDLVTTQHGGRPLVAMIHDLKICVERNGFLLTGFQFWRG